MRTATILPTLLLASSLASAQSIVLQHSGYLLDGDDLPVSGTKTVTFTLYSSPTGGAGDVVWSESYDVAVHAGAYTAALGSGVDAGKQLLTVAQVTNDTWLAVNVDGVDLSPRLQIGMVGRAGSAQTAADAQRLGGVLAADYLRHDAGDANRVTVQGDVVLGTHRTILSYTTGGYTRTISTNGLYCGRASPRNGNFSATDPQSGETVSGYPAGKILCESACNAPEAHMCTPDELVTGAQIRLLPPATSYWVASGKYSLYNGNADRDCGGFATASGTILGASMTISAGATTALPNIHWCDNTLYVACCR